MIMGRIKKEFKDDIDNDDWKKKIYVDDDDDSGGSDDQVDDDDEYWSKATEEMRTLRPDMRIVKKEYEDGNDNDDC